MKNKASKIPTFARAGLVMAGALLAAACGSNQGSHQPEDEADTAVSFSADENTVVQEAGVIIDSDSVSSKESQSFSDDRGNDMIKFSELSIEASYTIETGARNMALRALGGKNSYDKKLCENNTNDYGDEVACTPEKARDDVEESNASLVEVAVRQSITEAYDDILRNCSAVDFELNAERCKAFAQASIQTAFNAKVQLSEGAQTPVTITGVSFEVEFAPISRAMVEQKIHGADRIQIVVNPAAPSN